MIPLVPSIWWTFGNFGVNYFYLHDRIVLVTGFLFLHAAFDIVRYFLFLENFVCVKFRYAWDTFIHSHNSGVTQNRFSL